MVIIRFAFTDSVSLQLTVPFDVIFFGSICQVIMFQQLWHAHDSLHLRPPAEQFEAIITASVGCRKLDENYCLSLNVGFNAKLAPLFDCHQSQCEIPVEKRRQ